MKAGPLRIALALVCAGVLLSSPSAAQIQLGGLDRATEAKKQHVELLTDSLQLTADKVQEVELRFRVEPGFHINSHKPKDELLIPTELKLEPGAFTLRASNIRLDRTSTLPSGAAKTSTFIRMSFA